MCDCIEKKEKEIADRIGCPLRFVDGGKIVRATFTIEVLPTYSSSGKVERWSGTLNDPEFKFCPYCGNKIDSYKDLLRQQGEAPGRQETLLSTTNTRPTYKDVIINGKWEKVEVKMKKDDWKQPETERLLSETCGMHQGGDNSMGNDLLRWRSFVSEPPLNSDTENRNIIAASKLIKPGEFCIDIARYNVNSGNYERDFFKDPIEWWRPIGPMPKI